MPNLSDSNNWITIFQDSISITGEPSKENRLPNLRIQLPLRTSYHRITLASQSALPHWWRGGWIALQVKDQESNIYSDIYRQIEDIADIANHRLPMLATDAEISDLQTQSRFAAHCEQIARTMVRYKTDRITKVIKLAPKPLHPWKLFNNPATNLARVLWQSGIKLGVSEGFIAYGASQVSVADRRGLSLRTVNRHLSNQYRVSESPVRRFRGFVPCGRYQINRRLNRSEGAKLDLAVKIKHLYSAPELQSGKYWRNREGRWFERLPCIYEEMPEGCHLRKVKFRRSRLGGPTEKYRQFSKDYWIDKNKLLKVFQRPENFSD